MNRMNLCQPSYAVPRDPGMAAMLSIVPGLGQLYNGERRKGVLFLDVAAINFTILWVMLFTDPIIKAVVSFGQTFHVQPNKIVIESLQAAHIGSPLSIIVLGLFLTFAAYAIRDAYDRANVTRKRSIYPECVVEMPEATSGSYLFHAAAMISLFVLALFFVHPVKEEKNIVVEFVYDQPEVQEKVDSHKLSDKNSRNAGKVSPHSGAASGSQAPSKPRETRQQTPQPPQPVSQQTRAQDAQPPQPVPQQPRQVAMLPPVRPTAIMPARPITPAVPTQVAPQPTMPAITPRATMPTTSIAPPVPIAPVQTTMATAPPAPTMPVRTSTAPSILPMPVVSHAMAGLPGAAAVQPVKMSTTGSGNSAPVPVAPRGFSSVHAGNTAPAPMTIAAAPGAPIGGPVPIAPGRSTSTGSNSGSTAAPGPSKIDGSRSGASSHGSSLAVAPRVGVGGHDGQPGAADANNDPRQNSTEARKSPDFASYMAELQRRIKRNWFPPRELQTKRVAVIFTITPGGHLLNLRLERPSGSAAADNAALRAVEQAAPFAKLPAGADGNVDIQFTFDYNVFGGGRGTFRDF